MNEWIYKFILELRIRERKKNQQQQQREHTFLAIDFMYSLVLHLLLYVLYICIYSASERMRVNNFTFNAGQMFLFEWECAFTQFRCSDSISIYFWKCSLCLWYAMIYLYICWLNKCDVVAPHMRAFAGR